MPIIKVNLKKQTDHSYPIEIGSGLVSQLPKMIAKLGNYSGVAIITDTGAQNLYGQKLKQILGRVGIKTYIFPFPPGEKSKIQKTKTLLEEAMLKAGCDRKTLVVALGGGVVGDLAGFVAATYMRGVDYIQLPTTLLAMVDSSVGGKTGIDTPQGKNLIGAFWQPKMVLVDLDFLKTLPQKHFVNGLVEAIKMFLTHDAKSFEYAEKNLSAVIPRSAADEESLNLVSFIRDPSARPRMHSGSVGMTHKNKVLKEIIFRALKIKTETISKDERESGPRMFLNFGHTIGHALEKISNYKLLHGEAVALGILAESKISLNLGILSQKDYNRIVRFFARLGFDKTVFLRGWKLNEIIKLTAGDKKARGGYARYILLEKIGQVYKKNTRFAHEVGEEVIRKSLKI